MHFLVIPKHRDGLSRMTKAEDRHEKLLGHLLVVASKVARQGAHWQLVLQPSAQKGFAHRLKGAENLTDGYRVVINDGANGCAPRLRNLASPSYAVHSSSSVVCCIAAEALLTCTVLSRPECVPLAPPHHGRTQAQLAAWLIRVDLCLLLHLSVLMAAGGWAGGQNGLDL